MIFISVSTDNYSSVDILPQISPDFTPSFLYIPENACKKFPNCLSHDMRILNLNLL